MISRVAHDASAPLNGLWHIHGFADAQVFVTLAGHVGVAFKARGADFLPLDTAERERAVRLFSSGLRLLNEHMRVYQYLVRRPAAPLPVTTDVAELPPLVEEALHVRTEALNQQPRYDLDVYLVLLYEDPAAGKPVARLEGQFTNLATAAWHYFVPQTVVSVLDAQLEAAVATVRAAAGGFVAHLAGVLRLDVLDQQEAFAFFCRLVSYAAPPVAFRQDRPVHEQMAREKVTWHHAYMTVGPAFVQVLTMREPTDRTFVLILEELFTLRGGSFVVCLEWQRLELEGVKRDLDLRRRHWNNKRRKADLRGRAQDPDVVLHDDSAKAMVDQLGAMNTAMVMDSRFPGQCSLTVVAHGSTLNDVAETTTAIWKVLAKHDGRFLHEMDEDQILSWGAIVPGGRFLNVRYLRMLDINCADLSPLFTIDGGEPSGAITVFQTPTQIPYHFHLGTPGDDTRHGLLLGATGSGKTTWLNHLIMQLQPFRVRVLVVTYGKGYEKLTKVLGGNVTTLGAEVSDVRINPFSLAQTPENLSFLFTLCKLLIMSGDDAFILTREQDTALHEQIAEVYAIGAVHPARRRLATLAWLLRAKIPERLDQWVEDGAYGHVFDNEIDTLEIADVQSFDCTDLAKFPALLEPVQFYVLRRMEARLSPHVATVCIWDELEMLLTQPVLRAHIEAALPGMRKANGIMLLATQHVEKLAATNVLQKVIESCPTTYFFDNAHRDTEIYTRLFHLNERELDLLCHLQRKRQFLIKRTGVSKVCDLALTPWELDLYSHSVVPMQKRQTAAERVAS